MLYLHISYFCILLTYPGSVWHGKCYVKNNAKRHTAHTYFIIQIDAATLLNGLQKSLKTTTLTKIKVLRGDSEK
jgi:hypothetical protein